MYDELIRDLEMYARIAEEGDAVLCGDLMRRAAQALKKETAHGRAPETR